MSQGKITIEINETDGQSDISITIKNLQTYQVIGLLELALINSKESISSSKIDN